MLATRPGPGITVVMRQTRFPPPETEKGEATPVQSLDRIPLNAEPWISIFSWHVDTEAAWRRHASVGWVGGQSEQIQILLINETLWLIPLSHVRGSCKIEVPLYLGCLSDRHWLSQQPGETLKGVTRQDSGALLSPAPKCSGWTCSLMFP